MCNQLQTTIDSRFGTLRWWRSAEGEVQFLASDMAKGLGYSSAAAMIRTLDDDEKGMQIVHTPGGEQQMSVITEAGFYHAAMKSRVEKAKEFRRWVTHEVLPQIRRTGGYIPVAQEDDEKTILCKALMIYKRTLEEKDALLEAQQKSLEAREEQIREEHPKVVFAEAVTSCEDSILIRDLAKLLTQNGVTIGQGRLFYWMRLHGYLFQRETRPIQKWVEQGLFDTTITLVNTHHGTKERITTKVTGKGQRYFIDGFVSGKFKAENGKL